MLHLDDDRFLAAMWDASARQAYIGQLRTRRRLCTRASFAPAVGLLVIAVFFGEGLREELATQMTLGFLVAAAALLGLCRLLADVQVKAVLVLDRLLGSAGTGDGVGRESGDAGYSRRGSASE